MAGCIAGGAYPERDGRAFLEKAGYEPSVIEAVVGRGVLTPEQIKEFSTSRSPDVRFLVAGNPHLRPQDIDLFLKDSNDYARSGAAYNPRLSPEQMERLFRDPSHTVYCSLARNPAVPEAMLLRLHKERNPGLVWFAMNPNCPEALRNEIRSSGDDLARRWLALTEGREGGVGQALLPAVLKVEEGRFVRDGRAYRGVGVNYFDLFIRVLNAPSNTTSLAGLKTLGGNDIPFARFSLGYGTKDLKRYFDDPAAYLGALDVVVRCAETNRVGLIPSMFWSFKEFPDLAGEPRDQWGNPDSETHRMMRRFVADVVTRYRASPAIWGWELGNEPNLAADLPNAAQFHKKGGTERDDIRAKDMVVMLSEFAREVRRHDPERPIFAGHSHPRASSWHNTAEKSWKPDTREQTLEIIRRDNPEPLDTHSLHIYASHDVTKELAAWATNHVDYLGPVVAQARVMKRPVWIGEFGLPSKGDDAGERAKFEGLIAAMEQTGVDLAAVWVFDLANQTEWNATFGNPRAYMLRQVAEANRRWNAIAAESR
jgi:hypothetical protein